MKDDNEKWFCIRSKTTGRLSTVGADGMGPVLVYFDRNDAESDVAAMQTSLPNLLHEVIELPAHPPKVCLPDGFRREAKAVAWTTQMKHRGTGEVYSVRITRPHGGDRLTFDELTAMFEVAIGHMQFNFEVLATNEITLGEIREEKAA
jgi:hypothetical protein